MISTYGGHQFRCNMSRYLKDSVPLKDKGERCFYKSLELRFLALIAGWGGIQDAVSMSFEISNNNLSVADCDKIIIVELTMLIQ